MAKPTIPKVVIDRIITQVALQPVTAMDTELQRLAVGTAWEKAITTRNSIFFELFYHLVRLGWSWVLDLIIALIPQQFVTYATGAMLVLHRDDHLLPAFLGIAAEHDLTIVKPGAVDLVLLAGSGFFVDEANPRRFVTVQDYSYTLGELSVTLRVRAVEVGARYNTSPGLITKSDAVLGVTSITNASPTPAIIGVDPETEEGTTSRILAVQGQKIQLGVEVYYLSVLKTVGGVVDATLDSVAADATLFFTIYGTGALGVSTVQAAQAAFDLNKMDTDLGVITASTPQNLALTLQINGAYDAVTVQTAAETYINQMPKRTNFEESLLIASLYSQVPALVGLAIIITPGQVVLTPSSYFVPVITFAVFV